MMSTEAASANLSNKERDIYHLECRRLGIPISDLNASENEVMGDAFQLTDELEGDLGIPINDLENEVMGDAFQPTDELEEDLEIAWQIVEDTIAEQQLEDDTLDQTRTTETGKANPDLDSRDGAVSQTAITEVANERTDMDHHHGGTLQTSDPAPPAPMEGRPDTKRLRDHQMAPSADIVGISILSTALLYHYYPDVEDLIEISTTWFQTILPESKNGPQFRATVFFFLMPIWIGIIRAIIGILYWVYIAIEKNRLDRAIKACKHKIKELDDGVVHSTEMLEQQNQLMELKMKKFELSTPDGGKKKRNLKKKKRVGVKKEEVEEST
ncbi:MAG: hypothetical protein Q9168_004035 [Polycauliona sp. 1 TL-2023]